jgi:hypothetical protein
MPRLAPDVAATAPHQILATLQQKHSHPDTRFERMVS